MNNVDLKQLHSLHHQHTLRPVVIAVTAAIGISGLLTGCGGGSHHGGGGGGATTQSLMTSGGVGGTTTGTGGSGGYVDLYAAAAKTAIEVLTSTSGAPDVSNTNVESKTGGVPLEVTSDKTIPVVPADSDLTGTDYFQVIAVPADCHIYKSDGNATFDNADVPVTGVTINDGVKLTLQNNQGDTGCIDVPNDIANDGTIKTEIRNTDPALNGGVALTADNYIGTGAITTSGACGTDLNPDAGDIDIYAYTAIYNAGDLSAAGADCDKGGNGGNIGLYVPPQLMIAAVPLAPPPVHNLWNGGTLDTSGGTSNADAQQGGYGGDVNLTIDVVTTSADQNGGRLISGGAIDTSGGDGVAGGGAGGGVYMYLYGPAANGDGVEASNIFVLAGIDTRGGAVTGTNGSGGDGGDIEMAIQSGGGSLELLGFGQITTTGGDGAEGSVALDDGIMSGGDVSFFSDGYDADYTNQADIDASGGNALVSGSGGSGGHIELYNDGGSSTINNSGNLTASGGNGVEGGGFGGYVKLYVWDGGEADMANITNSGKLTSLGGNTTTGVAGDGGYIDVEFESAKGTVSNMGAINNSGGNSTNGTAGSGGEVEIEIEDATGSPDNSVTNTASITTNGGVGATGGDGGSMYFYNGGVDGGVAATNSGSIDALGGAGTDGNGGHGGYVGMYGEPLTNKANINVSGGDGTASGGDGGDVYMYSISDATTATNTGTVTIAGGSPGGQQGHFYTDIP